MDRLIFMFLPLIKKIGDWVYPPVCLCCLSPVQEDNQLCSICWGQVQFIENPFCKRCGQPFELNLFETCRRCYAFTPQCDQIRSIFIYDSVIKKLILKFKHGDKLYLSVFMAQWMRKRYPELMNEADLVIPIPLYWTRLVKRQYNQAAILAQKLCIEESEGKFSTILRRKRPTPSQGHQSRSQRYENMKGAFYVKKPEVIKGKSILLVDDVVTSGATLEECAYTLKRAGAERVYAITIANVPFQR